VGFRSWRYEPRRGLGVYLLGELDRTLAQAGVILPRLTGNRCVVTGAAREIGRAIAKAFQAEGAIVNLDGTFLGCRYPIHR